MIRVTSIAQLFSLLPTKGIIGLDGVNGAGKSTLARQIADAFSASWFDVDDYINKKNGIENYASSLCYSNFTTHVTRDTSDLKIIDGIFLREVLKKSRLTCNITIFCSPYSQYEGGRRYHYEDHISAVYDTDALAFQEYLAKHRLPDSANIFYAWKYS